MPAENINGLTQHSLLRMSRQGRQSTTFLALWPLPRPPKIFTCAPTRSLTHSFSRVYQTSYLIAHRSSLPLHYIHSTDLYEAASITSTSAAPSILAQSGTCLVVIDAVPTSISLMVCGDGSLVSSSPQDGAVLWSDL
jgi:hypothetical protein